MRFYDQITTGCDAHLILRRVLCQVWAAFCWNFLKGCGTSRVEGRKVMLSTLGLALPGLAPPTVPARSSNALLSAMAERLNRARLWTCWQEEFVFTTTSRTTFDERFSLTSGAPAKNCCVFPPFIRQKLNRAPNWNWRGVLTLPVIAPNGWFALTVSVCVGGIPYCAQLATLYEETSKRRSLCSPIANVL